MNPILGNSIMLKSHDSVILKIGIITLERQPLYWNRAQMLSCISEMNEIILQFRVLQPSSVYFVHVVSVAGEGFQKCMKETWSKRCAVMRLNKWDCRKIASKILLRNTNVLSVKSVLEYNKLWGGFLGIFFNHSIMQGILLDVAEII